MPAAGLSRQGGAVATLSIFVEPMTGDFGGSRTALSGAVSPGGLLSRLSSPLLGRVLERRGARLVLCLAILATGTANMVLSLTSSLLMFYPLFCIARLNYAGPFDLGIYHPPRTGHQHRHACADEWIGAAQGFVAASLFGIGIGGSLTLLPIAWADYCGRVSYGAIRGIALSVQVMAQASGPLLSSILRDGSGSYLLSLQCCVMLSCLSVVAALLARRPGS